MSRIKLEGVIKDGDSSRMVTFQCEGAVGGLPPVQAIIEVQQIRTGPYNKHISHVMCPRLVEYIEHRSDMRCHQGYLNNIHPNKTYSKSDGEGLFCRCPYYNP
ncbi:hypothetical protein KY337_05235, partial [Candidatus Woesearchaeota archaeon]|nr:hypothetical protein [Candidatus Woesearchaeota archaeon]